MNHTRKDSEFQEILTTLQFGDIAVIKSLLEGEGIPYFFHNEEISQIRGLGAGPAKLMIHKDHLAEARELLKEFIKP